MDFNSINKELYNFYKKMISIRKENEPLKRGEFKTILVEGDVYAYSRYTRDEEIICIFNNGLYNAEISIPTKKNSAFDILNNTEYSISGGEICINTESKGKYVIKSV